MVQWSTISDCLRHWWLWGGIVSLCLAGAVIFILIWSGCTRKRDIQEITLHIPQVWQWYKKRFIEPDGRVYRPRNRNDTVSEGQAYALLIAVLVDDRETFDRVMDWTETHLSRKARFGDNLLAWHWEVKDGVVDWNSASDADVDYALALLFAYYRWGELSYMEKAKRLLSDILRMETIVVNNKRYLLPGTWGMEGETIILNPSYLSPAHFRIFHMVTGDGRWLELVDGTYDIVLSVSREFMGMEGKGLVPDWIGIRRDGAFIQAEGFSTGYGWDAIRIPLRIGLDYLWFRDERAFEFIKGIVGFYTDEWRNQGKRFFVEYMYDGMAQRKDENPVAYATSLIPFKVYDSTILPGIVEKLSESYYPEGYFHEGDNYYINSLCLLVLSLVDRSHEVMDRIKIRTKS